MPYFSEPEPLVLLEPPQPRIGFGAGRPAILLADSAAERVALLHVELTIEGFDVFQSPTRARTVDILESNPSILLVLLRLEGPESVRRIAELRRARPGLWIGMIVDREDRGAISQGYAAGANDLFSDSAPPEQTVARLQRIVPGAMRRRGAQGRMLRRRLKRAPREREGNYLRRTRELSATSAIALLVGVLLAVLTRSGLELAEEWTARIDRAIDVMQAAKPARGPGAGSFERWLQGEELGLKKESQRELLLHQRTEREESRIRDLLRFVVPQYSVPVR